MNDLIYRLRKRAGIRRNATTRKSVQEGKPDMISDLLEEAADAIESQENESDDTGGDGSAYNKYLLAKTGDLPRTKQEYENATQEVDEEKMKNDPCWDGYEMIGTKEKDGKKVPNCVKKD